MATKKKVAKKRVSKKKPAKTGKNRQEERFYPNLSIKEEEIVYHLVSGKTIKEAAELLNISYRYAREICAKPEFKEALKTEETLKLKEIKKNYLNVIKSATENVEHAIINEKDISLSWDYLIKTGNLPRNESEERKKEIIQEILNLIFNVESDSKTA